MLDCLIGGDCPFLGGTISQETGVSSPNLYAVPIPESLLSTLEALLARLVPRDQDPGAVELGAVAFVQERLTHDPALVPIYTQGLQGLADRGFADLDATRQDDFLKTWDPEFVALAATHAIEAVYTHPEGFRIAGFQVTA